MQVLSASVAWRVYELTQDPFDLGMVGLAQFGPMLLLMLYAGDVADRYDRRLVLAGSYVVEAICAALFIAATVLGGSEVWPYFAILILFGCARAFSGPAVSSFLPQIVPTEILPRAISISSSVFQVAVISGPALGGAALIWGADFAFMLSTILFSVVAILTFMIKRERVATVAITGSIVERVRDGIAFVRGRRDLLGAISLDLFAVLLGGAVALLPFFAKDVLHTDSVGFGLLKAGPAIGAAAVSILLGIFPLKRNAGLWMFGYVGLFGLATIVFGLSTNYYLSLAALAVIGGSDMVSVNVRHSLTQLATPDHMRGRVSSVSMLFIGASNELGEFESGVTADWWGAVPAVVVGGLGTLAVVGIWAYLFPELRRVDRLSDLKPG